MARINIDDDLETKKEFWKLLPLLGGDRDLALGKLVRFFRVAQTYYGRSEDIPERDLIDDGLECMILSGWAVPIAANADLYQVANPETHFGWYRQKKEAGKSRAKGSRDSGGKFTSGTPAEHQREPAVDQPLAPSLAQLEIHVDSASPTAPSQAIQLARIWNLQCGIDLPKIRDPDRLNSSRLRSIKARLKERPDLEEWEEAIMRMSVSPFCCGRLSRPGAHQNWRADFDFLLQPGRLDQALEGKWDSKAPPPSGPPVNDLRKLHQQQESQEKEKPSLEQIQKILAPRYRKNPDEN